MCFLETIQWLKQIEGTETALHQKMLDLENEKVLFTCVNTRAGLSSIRNPLVDVEGEGMGLAKDLELSQIKQTWHMTFTENVLVIQVHYFSLNGIVLNTYAFKYIYN